MNQATLYKVIQDGKAFYLFDADAASGVGVAAIIMYPQTMLEYDEVDEAREWFRSFMNKNNMMFQFKDSHLTD